MLDCFSPNWQLWWNRSLSGFMGWQGMLKLCFKVFLISCRSRNPATKLKDSSFRQYLKWLPAVTTVQKQIIVINLQKLLAFVQRLTFGFQLKIWRKYNWIRTAVWRLSILEIYQLIFCLIYDWTTDPWKTSESEAAMERCSAYWVKNVSWWKTLSKEVNCWHRSETLLK